MASSDITIDDLKEMGIEFRRKGDAEVFCQKVQDDMETRIGARMSEGVSEEELKIFEDLIDSDEPEGTNDEKIKEWLLKNRPDVQGIIAKVSQEIRDELIRYRGQILGMRAKCYETVSNK